LTEIEAFPFSSNLTAIGSGGVVTQASPAQAPGREIATPAKAPVPPAMEKPAARSVDRSKPFLMLSSSDEIPPHFAGKNSRKPFLIFNHEFVIESSLFLLNGARTG
jgi:hypothetical protein